MSGFKLLALAREHGRITIVDTVTLPAANRNTVKLEGHCIPSNRTALEKLNQLPPDGPASTSLYGKTIQCRIRCRVYTFYEAALQQASSSLLPTPFHLPPQNSIKPRLISFAVTLEPMDNIRIQPDCQVSVPDTYGFTLLEQ